MFKNHLKISWRNFKKQPFFTFLKTVGLAIGMAGFLLISLYIYDELSYDTMFTDGDRIHRVDSDLKFGGVAHEFAVIPAPMAGVLKEFSEVESACRFRTTGTALVKETDAESNVKELQTTFVDPSFFEVFGMSLLVGDPKTALSKPNTLIISKTAAEKHFGVHDAIGKSLLINNLNTYTVTGVIDDMPTNSFLRDYSIFYSMASNEDAAVVNWGSNNYQTFIKLMPNIDPANFQKPLTSVIKSHVLPGIQVFMPGITEENFIAAGNHLRYQTMALTDIHLHSHRTAEMNANNHMQNVYILSFVALFLIVLASVNFMNLSTAHSLKRAKEVGIRKTLGSHKKELIEQFLIESGFISFVSLIVALIIAAIAMPFFNDLANKAIAIPFTNPIFIGIVLFATVVLGLLSGSYPAFFMSRFIPVKVLSGGGKMSVGGSKVRNLLVIFQFAISVFLMVSTLVVYQQLKFIQNKDVGYSKEQVLVINDVYAAGSKVASFKQEVKKLPFVKNASLSSFFPTPSNRSDTTFSPEGKPEPENTLNMQIWGVDHDYVSTLDLKFVAGRDFDIGISSDSTAIIINESAAVVLGLTPEEAIGKRVTQDMEEEVQVYNTIIGVLKNFHFESLKENVNPLSLNISSRSYSMAVKIMPGASSKAIKAIENLWKQVVPGEEFNYYFMEDSFNNTYQAERRLGSIFMIFTLLSILIACLGLFGLASFNAEKRIKEIGVRKVLGASINQIAYKLSIDFLKLVAFAIVFALPLGWYAMNKWLENFSYRIDISWWVFVLSAFLAIGISVLTVGFQSVKAALANPVTSLQSE